MKTRYEELLNPAPVNPVIRVSDWNSDSPYWDVASALVTPDPDQIDIDMDAAVSWLSGNPPDDDDGEAWQRFGEFIVESARAEAEGI